MTLQRRRGLRLLLIVASGAVFLDVPPATALEPYAAQPQEIALMPEYCRAKIGGPGFAAASNYDMWAKRFGDVWLHMHHYCHGLKFVQRASRAGISKEDRGYDLNSALGEFDYIISVAPPDFWFLSEVHLQKALVLGRLGRQAEAAAEYRLVRQPGSQ